MTADEDELSRRTLLGALGSLGGAAALGGVGTVAVFTDTETLGTNTLTAGELDLKAGWTQYYVGSALDERILGVVRTVTDSGFPIAFASDDARAAYIDASRTERFPVGGIDETTPCTASPTATSRLAPRPRIDLEDVKPGDFGHLDFALALCDNPGQLWLQGGLDASDENGLTEPEAADVDEYSDDSPPTDGTESVLAIENDSLTVVLFGGFGVFWTYTFSDGRLANALLLESFTVQEGSASGAPASSRDADFARSFPPVGVPGTPYASTAKVDVDRATVQVTRTVELDPADALLSVDYAFEVTDGGPVEDLVVTQFVDFDLGEATGDTAAFRRDTARGFDYVEQADVRPIERIDAPPVTDADLFAGFGADRFSTAHAVGAADDLDPTDGSTSPFDQVEAGSALSGRDSFGPGDAQFALEYSLGRVVVGETATLSGAFALSPSPQQLKATLLKRQLSRGLGTGDLLDAIRTTLWYDTEGDGIRDENDPVCFEGSLAHLLALASTGTGLALDGVPTTPHEAGVTPPTDEARDCFEATPTVHNIGLLWELPVDHANELQGDSVSFDLGFYTEQCRHNDGQGRGGFN